MTARISRFFWTAILDACAPIEGFGWTGPLARAATRAGFWRQVRIGSSASTATRWCSRWRAAWASEYGDRLTAGRGDVLRYGHACGGAAGRCGAGPGRVVHAAWIQADTRVFLHGRRSAGYADEPVGTRVRPIWWPKRPRRCWRTYCITMARNVRPGALRAPSCKVRRDTPIDHDRGARADHRGCSAAPEAGSEPSGDAHLSGAAGSR